MAIDPQEEHEARVAGFPEAIREAHRHSSGHRHELLASETCGCFYCGEIYSPGEITLWIDHGQTALCARCGIDSVIGSGAGVPVTPAFLRELHQFWF